MINAAISGMIRDGISNLMSDRIGVNGQNELASYSAVLVRIF